MSQSNNNEQSMLDDKEYEKQYKSKRVDYHNKCQGIECASYLGLSRNYRHTRPAISRNRQHVNKDVPEVA